MPKSDQREQLKMRPYGDRVVYKAAAVRLSLGFGSNWVGRVASAYAVVVAGKDCDGPATRCRNKLDRVTLVTISRRLSAALEMDEYWLFSCAELFISCSDSNAINFNNTLKRPHPEIFTSSEHLSRSEWNYIRHPKSVDRRGPRGTGTAGWKSTTETTSWTQSLCSTTHSSYTCCETAPVLTPNCKSE